MKQMIKLGIILAIYCIVGCVGLAFVYNVTGRVIVQRQAADLQAGLHEVFPEASSFDKTDKITSTNPKITFSEAYIAKNTAGVLGAAVKVIGPSYGGDTTLLVGVSTEGTVTGVKVLENKDTAGLGANAANSSYYVDKATKTTFAGQFAGKKLTDAFEVKKDVIAITSATITSRSITSLVQAVGQSVSTALGIGGGAKGPNAVLPAADTVGAAATQAVSNVSGITVLKTYVGTKAGKVVGAAAEAKAKGYDGDVTVLVGVSADGTITGMQVTECTDSLGTMITTPAFAQQFIGKKADAALEIGKDITAVTGATHSSTGATQLVKATADALVRLLAGGNL